VCAAHYDTGCQLRDEEDSDVIQRHLRGRNFVLEHHATQFVRIRSRQEISEMVAKSTAKVVNGVLGATG
jgi:hypothetical protein